MEEKDFESVGIKKPGHIKKLSNAISNLRYQVNSCVEHAEPLKLFCVNCEIPICALCVTGKHENHNFQNLEASSKKFSENLETSLQKISEFKKFIDQKHQFLKQSLITLNNVKKKFF